MKMATTESDQSVTCGKAVPRENKFLGTSRVESVHGPVTFNANPDIEHRAMNGSQVNAHGGGGANKMAALASPPETEALSMYTIYVAHIRSLPEVYGPEEIIGGTGRRMHSCLSVFSVTLEIKHSRVHRG